MKNEEKLNWFLYWIGITFIMTCLAMSVAKATDAPDPCQWERDQAVSVCRALGRRSVECQDAVQDYRLCRAVKTGNDPLEGLQAQRCETTCTTDSIGITRCITRCYNERGGRT